MWNAVGTRTVGVLMWKYFRSFCTRRGVQLRGWRLKSCRHHYGGLRKTLSTDRRFSGRRTERRRGERNMSGSQHNPNGRQSQLGSGWSPLQVVIIIPLIVHKPDHFRNILSKVRQAHVSTQRRVLTLIARNYDILKLSVNAKRFRILYVKIIWDLCAKYLHTTDQLIAFSNMLMRTTQF